jgi:hypothetical protein
MEAAVYLGFKSAVPRDLPLPPQPVLQAYFIVILAGRGGRGSARGRRLGEDAAVASCMALFGSTTHLSVASFTTGLPGSQSVQPGMQPSPFA